MHERPVTVSGWTGSGYIISDPVTGSGAYKISGGANGGAILTGLATAVALSVVFFQIVTVVTLVAPWVSALASVLGLVINILLSTYLTDFQKVNLAVNRFLGAVIIGILFLQAGYVIFPLISILGAALAYVYALADLLIRVLCFAPENLEFRRKISYIV